MGGTVLGTLNGDKSLDPSGTKVKADATYTYIAPEQKKAESLVSLESRSKRDGTYGAPRIHIELRETYGIRIGRKRVERLMRQAGLWGVQKRRFRCTTRPGAPERFAPDLVQRHFAADRPNALWLADVTYVSTAEYTRR